MKEIAKCQNLESIDLTGSDAPASGLELLVEMEHLKSFRFESMRDADTKLEVIAEIPTLTELYISKSDIGRRNSYKSLSSMASLKVLDLSGTAVNTTYFHKNPLPESLAIIDLSDTKVTAEVIRLLPKGLTQLHLPHCRIGMKDIRTLEDMPHLTVLDAPGLPTVDIEAACETLPNARINRYIHSDFR